MAKYWLGVCYYFGYGVQQNIQKENELLGTNFERIASNNGNTTNIDNTINDVSRQVNLGSENTVNSETVLENNIFGEWSGSLLKYDWSGKHIEQKHLLNIEFKYDSIQETPIYSIIIEDQKLTGTLNRTENFIYFEDVLVKEIEENKLVVTIGNLISDIATPHKANAVRVEMGGRGSPVHFKINDNMVEKAIWSGLAFTKLKH
jgi:hypothetical protein